MTGMEGIVSRVNVIPVLAVDGVDSAVETVRALVAGGLPVVEITLRTPAAPAAIRAAAGLPGAVVGAGTVLTGADLQGAVDAGAAFAVSPGATPSLLTAARHNGVPFMPGVATPSEVQGALEAGFTHLKFFPAGVAGGVAMLRALAGPFADVRFCPTGGIDPASAPDYLALDNVVCVGGSWLAPPASVAAGDWAGITERARAAAALGGRTPPPGPAVPDRRRA
ncbi:bifunctional 4-hydroxy-2-oxoglutarate aldolase/2-dehydro-3-deoxy-phosphogluconate aldolase [Arhodomonas aquaeolei]|uniref:bifunctional 4-hydroxy-2-oxoglutarate aldolase/2-dehydro-3-deoxy-phosphogluconate aldolase n=2 Tax=Arhodomonas TaxID=2368 RepID=UPI001B7FD94A|nr:bifunctional 4-hydroxy-2-oxoglutarate aldolase/2-dehydro-3-deoxy-phosphogluconate aldolase [Arhodomonas aquaeolei]MCS4505848.1 bifunctional 4-hydroxy-2-oxoglutarate aldolase/2-dehydro-3-deoxy-phosphogluconate aldolase [Arhodomonas aquaeolei]